MTPGGLSQLAEVIVVVPVIVVGFLEGWQRLVEAVGVRIEVEVAPHLRAQVGLIEAPEIIKQSRVRRQRLELIALRSGKAHDPTQD
jgi:hypothetical protein